MSKMATRPQATRSQNKAKKGIIRRRETRVLGLFIDGIGLDRAARRLHRKVDMASLVKGLSVGASLAVCRYYTVIPHEDDARQLAFLDAVARAGLTIIVKRLPPKGVDRQVSTDLEMAADIVAFSLGQTTFTPDSEYRPAEPQIRESRPLVSSLRLSAPKREDDAQEAEGDKAEIPAQETSGTVKRIVTIVCPSAEIAYPISLANHFGADTVTADFSAPRMRNILKSSAKWIDLSTSETIWRQ